MAAGIDVDVLPGAIHVIAGSNGVGKSTLVKTMARQLKPVCGEVMLNGANIWDVAPVEFARQVSYVPQSLELSQDLTVFELVMLGRTPHQRWWSWQVSQEDRDAVKDALEKTETWDLRTKYLSNLSGGERQRALLAGALAQQPRFILLDEPTAHLDFKHQLELADLLAQLKQQGLGLLLVLHDLNLIARIADYVVLLGKGQEAPSPVVSRGDVTTVLTQENLRRAYEVEVDVIEDPKSANRIYLARSQSARNPVA